MIETLHIKNYALIDDLTIEFKPGLNIFTGSTGAGKTIIIGAVSLVLGERASEESIRSGSKETIVEAEIIPDNNARNHISDFDESETLLIRREIKKSGRSKIVVNDRQITLATLKEIGQMLTDISGQHRQKGLTDSSSHLEIIDRYADLSGELQELNRLYENYLNLKLEIDKLERQREQIISEKELMEFQAKEIEATSLSEGEDEQLEKEKLQLANAESIKAACQLSQTILFDDEGSASERIQGAAKELSHIGKYSDSAIELAKKLEELSIHLDEAGIAIRDLGDSFDFDPGRLEIVEDRLALIKKLKRKYGGTIDGIIAYGEQAKERVTGYADLDGRLKDLGRRLKEMQAQLSNKAIEISGRRKEAARKLEKEVMKHLGDLAMAGAKFEVGFLTRQDDSGAFLVDSQHFAGDETGFDIVEFMICPNPGEQLKPLASTASGGELSRILLAIISSLVDAFPRGTLVFDEIDSGISGQVASQVGKKLQKLAKNRQVICITHLHQIASRGDAHFKVYKGKNKGRMVTRVKFLEGDERVEEIARLLSGEKISDTALHGAAQLLEEGRS